jgi:Kef-type K+ transport system membrane component KefB
MGMSTLAPRVLRNWIMHTDPLVFSIFVIFAGAAIFATMALFTGQSLLMAYIALGCVVGPWSFGLIEDPKTIASVGHVALSSCCSYSA